ncbi:MAG: LLM class F420-dependent oxidoreductase, partial [Chloroflexi bacterium]|nr:LLM class F420-dependent oxidoreductase [Chloroflexota bacterium]
VKVGVQLHPQHTSFEAYRRAWLEADALGVDVILDWDHFFPLYGDRHGPHFEGWTSVAAIAPQTSHAQVGTLVLSMGYRNPSLLSSMAKTLDHATGGRLILGLGAGWAQRDYNEYGYEFGTAGDRLRELERGLGIIKERWEKDVPKPVRGTIPILIGGGGEKVTLRITARYADLWHGFGNPETWSAKNEVLNRWSRELGRDPAEIARIAPIDARALDRADDWPRVGATHVMYELGTPFDLAPIRQLLDWRDRIAGEPAADRCS